jgi:hypothetical protein
MKKIISIVSMALIALSAFVFTGCENHAYSISTNIFRYTSGGSAKDVKNSLSIEAGETVYVFATDKDHNRFNRGSYEATSQDPATATASIGEFDGSPCIKITGVAEGSTSVSLDFLLDGFKLYKSVSVQVK